MSKSIHYFFINVVCLVWSFSTICNYKVKYFNVSLWNKCLVFYIYYLTFVNDIQSLYVNTNRICKSPNCWKLTHKRLYLSTALLFAPNINNHRCNIVEYNKCTIVFIYYTLYNSVYLLYIILIYALIFFRMKELIFADFKNMKLSFSPNFLLES